MLLSGKVQKGVQIDAAKSNLNIEFNEALKTSFLMKSTILCQKPSQNPHFSQYDSSETLHALDDDIWWWISKQIHEEKTSIHSYFASSLEKSVFQNKY